MIEGYQIDFLPAGDDARHSEDAVCLRYGVPEADMCELVRDGFDRDDALTVAEEFNYAPLGARMAGLKPYAERWKRERETAVLAADDEPPF